jgi:hypothetical protein
MKPFVITDLNSWLTRSTVGDVLFDLQNHLPKNLSLYQQNRIHGNWFPYDRIYAETNNKLHALRFIVKDTDPAKLEVIYVLHTA